MEQSFNVNRISRYSIRKLSIGAASVLIGISFAIGGPQIIKADEKPASEQVVKTSNEQEQKDEDNNQSHANITNTDQNIDIDLPDKQEGQSENKDALEDRTENITSADKNNVLKIKVKKSVEQAQEDNNQLTLSSKKSLSDNDSKDSEQLLNPARKHKDDRKANDTPLNTDADTETVSLKSLGKGPKLSADQLFGAKFEVPATLVGDKDDFEQAITTAPTDGTEKLIELVNDINLANDLITIRQGQNIVITNDNQQRKLMIGNQIRVTNGGHLKFKAKQKDGIVITRPTGDNPAGEHLVSSLTGYENHDRPVLDIIGSNSYLAFNNTDLTGFNYIYTTSPGYQPVGIVDIERGAQFDFIDSEIEHNIIYDYDGLRAGWASATVAALTIYNNAICHMTGSKVDDNQIGPTRLVQNGAVPYSYSAGVIVNNASLIANKSQVSNNSGGTVGGIFAYNNGNSSDHTIVELHACTISNNQGYSYAGGIFFYGAGAGKVDATIDQNSQIINNSCGERSLNYSPFMDQYLTGKQALPLMGGGMSVSDGASENQENIHVVHLVIDGANISNNFSLDTGGGIYIDTDGVEIKKAIISHNISKFGRGGGIYLSVAPYKLRLNNTVIYNNHAIQVKDPFTNRPYWFATGSDSQEMAGSGGGLWLCPTGHASIKITNGMAIFDNHADYGGDELWNEHKNPGVTATIADRILGGGNANWTHDRDSLDGQKFIGPEIGNNVGLKSHATEDAKDLAKALASVFIFDNEAAWGGGVGSNGGIITNANHDQDAQNKDITIKKHWVDNNDPERPKSITIDVIATVPGSSRQYKVTSFNLTAANNWTYQLADLPANVVYDFVEDASGLDINGDHQPDYIESEGRIIFIRKTGDTSYYALTITNTKKSSGTPTPTPTPSGSQPTEPQPTQPQSSNPQASVPQPIKPQPSNVPVHPSKKPARPKANKTVINHTRKVTNRTPIKSVKQTIHQHKVIINKIIKNKVVQPKQKPNKPELPQTSNNNSAMFLTGLGMILLASMAEYLIDHQRHI